MYAIIETGGKQFKVSEGDIIKVEKLNAEIGSTFEFKNVLMISNGNEIKIGDELSSANVTASVLEEGKGKKVVVFKYKPKKGSRKKRGHRQPFTKLKIEKING